MQPYLDFMRHVREHGHRKDDRTGTGTLSVFGYQMRFDLARGFPLLTTKKVHTKSIIHELLWFLAGDTNTAYLKANGVSIWDEWADANGDLGPVYGYQWRSWPAPDGTHVDQMANLLAEIRRNPDSRRLIVSAWNVAEIPRMKLPPCHLLFQFYVAGGRLSCQMYQRSADIFLGVPFNIASYALLTHMIAQQCDLGVGDFIWTGGDCHLYLNHLEQVDTQLARPPFPLPRLIIRRKPPTLFDYVYDDFEIADYQVPRSVEGARRGVSDTTHQGTLGQKEARREEVGGQGGFCSDRAIPAPVMLLVSRRPPANRRRPQELLDHAARGADPFCQLHQFGLLGWRIESTEFAIRHIGIASLTIKPVVGELRCKRIHGGSR